MNVIGKAPDSATQPLNSASVKKVTLVMDLSV